MKTVDLIDSVKITYGVFALEGLKTYQVKMLTYVKNRINSCISVASQNKGLK